MTVREVGELVELASLLRQTGLKRFDGSSALVLRCAARIEAALRILERNGCECEREEGCVRWGLCDTGGGA